MMVACIGLAFLLVAVLLIFGPTIQRHLGRTLGMEDTLAIWWGGAVADPARRLAGGFRDAPLPGPNVDQRRWSFLSLGSAAAVIVWLIVSGGFAFYTAHFSSYNKTWGSLSAVIIMLTWLWLTGLALLFGGELNAEAERTRMRPGSAAAERSPRPASQVSRA